jgi:hypothetical protein
MFFGFSPVVHALGFRRDCYDGFRLKDEKGSRVGFQDYRRWEEIPGEIKALLAAYDPLNLVGFDKVLGRGWRLWMGTRDKQLAVYAWTRSGKECQDFFFPTGSNSVLVWYTETSAGQRGLGLQPLILDHIVRILDCEGIECAYIACAKYNYASRLGIEKANFRLIGHGLMRARSGQGVLWISAKVLPSA